MNTNLNQQYGPINSVDMSDNKGNPKHGYRMIFITLTVLLLAVGGFMVSRNEYLQQIMKTPTITPTATNTGMQEQTVDVPISTITDRQGAWLEVASDQGNQVAAGQTITLLVRGSSAGKDVTGYDMLIAYDRNMLELSSVTSEIADYQIFQFDKQSHITVTGIKDFQKRDPVFFDNSTVLKVILKAKKAGSAVVSVIPQSGKEKTQLVDAGVHVMQPQIGSLSLEIQ